MKNALKENATPVERTRPKNKLPLQKIILKQS